MQPTATHKVLCYVRPWNKTQFSVIAQAAFPGIEPQFISEHRSVDSYGLPTLYYRKLKNKTIEMPEWVSAECVEDMILRCRLLRSLPRRTAEKHLAAMAYAVEQCLDSAQPDVILSLTIDSFILDLLHLRAQVLRCPFIGLVPTFVNGFFRITARGGATILPQPTKVDIEALRQELVSVDYRPQFIHRSSAAKSKGALLRWLKVLGRFWYFKTKRYAVGDRYNYHYWSSEVVSKQFFSLIPPKEPGNIGWQAEIKQDPRTLIYLPLQMYPECTVDYWCTESQYVDYYKTLEKLIARYHQDFLFVIKEHPAVMGTRPRKFYSRLTQDSRILVIPTYTPSNILLDSVDAVMVWTGTVGFEAALRGKPVLSLCQPYYAGSDRIKTITLQTEPADIHSHIELYKAKEITAQEQRETIISLSTQLLPGIFKNDGGWKSDNSQDNKAALQIGHSIRAYHHSLMLAP